MADVALDILSNVDPDTLMNIVSGTVDIVASTIHLVERREAKAEAKAQGLSSGHACDICRKEIYLSTERFQCK